MVDINHDGRLSEAELTQFMAEALENDMTSKRMEGKVCTYVRALVRGGVSPGLD